MMGRHQFSLKTTLVYVDISVQELFATWVIFYAFFHLLILFHKINFFEKFFREYHQSLKQFGSGSDQEFKTVCKRRHLEAKS